MVATTTATPLMTAEDFYEWANQPERGDAFFELEDGKVIEVPSPGEIHGVICWYVSYILGHYFVARGGHLMTNDTGLVVKRRPDTVRGPDIMAFLEARASEEMLPGHTKRVPTLVVEVRSPSDREHHILKRVKQYHGHGIPLVWVVDPFERIVTVYCRGEFPEPLDDTDTLTGSGVLPDFSCRVAEFFALPGQSPAP